MTFSELIDDMMDELRGAEKYASLACHATASSDEKKTLAEMSKQELSHYHNLNKMASDYLGRHPISDEMAVYQFLSKKFTDWENRILFDLSRIK